MRDHHRPAGRDDRRARLRHQVGRPQRDDRPAPEDPHQQGRGEGAQPCPRDAARAAPGRADLRELRRPPTTPTATASSTSSTTPATAAWRSPRRQGRRAPNDLLDPQDVLIAFTDGNDDDGNGFKDDMVGWDFLDDDNDPYDDVQYGHGTGEARDSTAEANNGGELGRLPELHVDPHARGRLLRGRREPLRAGRRLRHRQRRGGRAGGARHAEQLEARPPGRQVRLRPRRGGDRVRRRRGRPAQQLALVAARGDPGELGHQVRRGVHAATRAPTSSSTAARTSTRRSRVAIPSVSCSSDATGRGSGMAG